MDLIFAGTPEFAAVHLQRLLDQGLPIRAVYTQPDRPAGRGRQARHSAVKGLALAHDLPVCQPRNFKSAAARQELADWQADLMIVVAYGLILPGAVLDTPRLGCINVHASLLPRWRGAAPIQRAIAAGDTETGVCIMQMDAGLDTGPVLQEIRCPILASDTGGTLHDRLARLGADALLSSLNTIRADKAQAVPQAQDGVTYASKLNKAEAQIDWQQPARQLALKIRAFNPWPVCYTSLDGKNLRIWAARAMPAAPDQPPGTILQVSAEGVDVATGEGCLRILHLQKSGSRALPVAEFINAGSLQPGIRLGDTATS